jgi:hypothetical protein
MVAVMKCFDCRLHNVLRGFEIGLADPKINDVLPSTRQYIGPSQNIESRFGAEPAHFFCESQHVVQTYFLIRKVDHHTGR